MTGVLSAMELAYWQQTTIRLLAGLVAVLLLTGGVVYLYLFKFVSFMQPARAHGSRPLRSLRCSPSGRVDQKEDISTKDADKFIFGLAPRWCWCRRSDVCHPRRAQRRHGRPRTGIYYVLAISSLSVIGILMAGWASAKSTPSGRPRRR